MRTHPLVVVVVVVLAMFTAGCFGSTRDFVRAENRLELARDLLAKGETGAAETEARRALGYDAESEEAYNLLGLISILRAQGNSQLLERIDCMTGPTADSLRRESDKHMRAAGDAFTRATELAPNYGEAWANHAVVALYFRDWRRAIELANRALANLARLESASLARANLGWAYLELRDHVHAQTELLQANQGPRYFCLGKYRLAAVYFAREEWALVNETLAPQLSDDKMCPPLAEARYLAGRALLRVNDQVGAARALNACVEVAPRSCQARECKKALAEIRP